MSTQDELYEYFRTKRREAFWKGFFFGVVATLVVTTLTGCVTPTLRVEVEHVSHPTVGWPVGPQSVNGGNVEHDITQANALVHWERDGWYSDAGLGYNLLGKNGGGFTGPALTGTIRVGHEWKFGR
jgi:hypothetical protein